MLCKQYGTYGGSKFMFTWHRPWFAQGEPSKNKKSIIGGTYTVQQQNVLSTISYHLEVKALHAVDPALLQEHPVIFYFTVFSIFKVIPCLDGMSMDYFTHRGALLCCLLCCVIYMCYWWNFYDNILLRIISVPTTDTYTGTA